MQFVVPQFSDVEDKIIGPLTLKQFMLTLGAALFLMLLWYLFRLWFVILIGAPIAGFLFAVIFVKINGRPFLNYATSFFSFITKPRIYVWKRKENKN